MDAVTVVQVVGLVLAPVALGIGVWALVRVDRRSQAADDDEL